MIIRGSKHTFGDSVRSLGFDDFKKHCEGLKIFAQLPVKERNDKIKEAYGKYSRDVKQGKKSKPGSDLHSNDVKSDRGDTGAEQGADVGGEDLKGKKDQAKILDKKLRKPEKENKS
jgi:hypothetical protein